MSQLCMFMEALATYLLLKTQPVDGVLVMFPSGSAFVSTGTFIGVLLLMRWLRKLISPQQCIQIKVFGCVVAVIFSVFIVGGKIYDIDNPAQTILSLFQASRHNKLGLLIMFVGAFLLCYRTICAMEGIVSKIENTASLLKGYAQLERILFGRFGILAQALFMLVVWVPQIVIRYPGFICTDAFHSLSQYLGMQPYTTKHPIVFAVTFGKFIQFGIDLGKPNYGLFLYVVVVSGLMVLSILYMVYCMRLLEAPTWLCVGTLLLMAIMPSPISQATLVQKDTIFMIGFFVVVSELALLLAKQEVWLYHPITHAVILLIGSFALLYRNNGPIVIVIIATMLFIYESTIAIRERCRPRSAYIIAIAVLGAVFLGGRGLSSYLEQKYHAERATTRVIYSSIIQQTGRYLALYPDEITEDETESLLSVIDLPIERYADKYYAYKFDNLKNFFNQDVTKQQLKEYLSVWLSLGRRHPDAYLSAIIHQNYMIFSPLVNNYTYKERMSAYWKMKRTGYTFDFSELFSEKESLIKYQDKLLKLYAAYSNAPIAGMTVNTGLFVLLFFGMAVYAIVEKRGDWFILAVPLLAILAFTFFGPAIKGNARYMYPFVWTVPLLAAVLLCNRAPYKHRRQKHMESLQV